MPDNGGILVSPLDWGLGHAARLIPLIKVLLQQRQSVVLAAKGAQAALLAQAFPALPLMGLPDYQIEYSRQGSFWKTASQVPKILRAIRSEHEWLQAAAKQYPIKAIISDNRYGLWHPGIPSVILSHQLQVQLPPLLRACQGALQSQVYGLLRHFDECWVPDFPNGPSALSGSLGHPSTLPSLPVHYIGWLSRFAEGEPYSSRSFAYKAAVVLSGPEPQRTVFEQIILQQAQYLPDPLVVLRGLPGSSALPGAPANVALFNHLPAQQFEPLLLQSEFLISRGGYSTLMDAFTLGMNGIFVPTPGQTEQEYLCREMHRKEQAISFSQRKFHLKEAIQKASRFQFKPPKPSNDWSLHSFIGEWLRRCGLAE
jgi:UDP:flavonoid glycosyltransferase YjiC (YdhE family)